MGVKRQKFEMQSICFEMQNLQNSQTGSPHTLSSFGEQGVVILLIPPRTSAITHASTHTYTRTHSYACTLRTLRTCARVPTHMYASTQPSICKQADAYNHAHMYANTHAHAYLRTRICMHARMRTRMHSSTRMHAHMHARARTHTHMYAHMHMHARAHTYAHTQAHTHTHA